MPNIDYPSTGQPAPSGGGPNGWSWFKGIIDTIFLFFNNHINGVNNQHTDMQILGGATAHPLTQTRALTTGTNYQSIDMLMHVANEIIDGDQTPANWPTKVVPATLAVMNAALVAATSIANGAATSGTLVKWNSTGGLTPNPGSVPRVALREFTAYAASPASTQVNYHGFTYIDKTGSHQVWHTVADGNTIHAAPIVVGQERWDIVSMSPATGGFNLTTGSAINGGLANIGTNALPPATMYPISSSDQIAYAVYTKYGATVIKDVSDGVNGYIINAAMLNIGGNSLSSQGGLSTSDPVFIFGGGGSEDTNAIDPYTLFTGNSGLTGLVAGHRLENMAVGFKMVRGNDLASSPNSPHLGQTLYRWHNGMESRMQDFINFAGTNQVIIGPSIQIFSDNIPRYNAGVTITCSVPSNQYTIWYLVADCSGNTTDGSFSYTCTTVPPSLGSTRMQLLVLINNGSGFFGYPVWDASRLLTVSGPQIVSNRHSLAVIGSQTVGAASVVTGLTKVTMAEKAVVFPAMMQASVWGKAQVYSAAGATAQCQFYIDGIPLGVVSQVILSAGAVAEIPVGGTYGDTDSPTTGFPIGTHNVDLWVSPGTVSGAIIVVQEVSWECKLYGMPT